jgi:KTSC domain
MTPNSTSCTCDPDGAMSNRYFEFSEEQYLDFLNAESLGRYFLSQIRNRYERLAKLQAA